MGEVRKLYHCFRPSPDGNRILLGARGPGCARSTASAITHSWPGNVAFIRANRPLLFTHAGLHYAVGYCGSGTVWAPWRGHKTALHILGDPQAASHFRRDPPAFIPFYRGKPRFLPLVMSGYRLQGLMRGGC